MDFRDELYELIEGTGTRKKDFAERAGISMASIRRLKNRKNAPSVRNVRKMCIALGVTKATEERFVGQAQKLLKGVSIGIADKELRKKALETEKQVPETEKFVQELLKQEASYVHPMQVGIDNLILRTKRIVENLQHVQDEAALMEQEYTGWLHKLMGASTKVTRMRDDLRDILYTKHTVEKD